MEAASAQATQQQQQQQPPGGGQSRGFSSFPRIDESPQGTADLAFGILPVLGRGSLEHARHGSGAYAQVLEAQVGGCSHGHAGHQISFGSKSILPAVCVSVRGCISSHSSVSVLPPSQASQMSGDDVAAGAGQGGRSPGGQPAQPASAPPGALPASQRSSAEHLRPSPFDNAPHPPGPSTLVHGGSNERDFRQQPGPAGGHIAAGPAATAATQDTDGVAEPDPAPQMQMSSLMSGWVPDEEQTD